MRRAHPVRRVLGELWLVALLVAVLLVVTALAPSLYFPPLGEVLAAIARGFVDGPLLGYLAYSLGNLLAGLAIGAVAGVSIGLLLGMSELAHRVVDPALQLLRATPKVALIPLLVALLGLGAEPKIAIVALAAVWPILLNTVDGVRGLEANAVDVARAFQIPLGLRIRRVVLPAALPQILAGVAIALSLGVTVLVVSEMYAATQGIGFSVLQSGRSFDIVGTWAGTIVLGVVGYLLNLAMLAVERRALHWHHGPLDGSTEERGARG